MRISVGKEARGCENMSIGEIEKNVDNGEAELIVAHNSICQFPKKNALDCLFMLVNKLRVGGKLTLELINPTEICRLASIGVIDSNKFNETIYSQRSVFFPDELFMLANSNNLKVYSYDISEGQMYLEVIK